MYFFSQNLTYLRQTKKLTQEEAAAAIGVKLKRYQAWEEGRSHPHLKLMVKVCDVLDFHDIYRMLTSRILTPPFRLQH